MRVNVFADNNSPSTSGSFVLLVNASDKPFDAFSDFKVLGVFRCGGKILLVAVALFESSNYDLSFVEFSVSSPSGFVFVEFAGFEIFVMFAGL